jgi:ribose-phosphate pyrophosphokinase
MEEVFVLCSGVKHLKNNLLKIKKNFSYLNIDKFPDGEIDLSFRTELKGKKVILLQSFHGDLNEKIIETLFSAHTAKDLGAKKVELFSFYFPYFRNDKRFRKGECISIKVMSKIFNIFDKMYFIEPHLHRIKKIERLFSKGKKIEISNEISDYIKLKKIENPLLIGPDIESEQWVKKIAEKCEGEYLIFKKKRYSPRNVKIKINNSLKIKNRNIILIDDIVSTGNTLLETLKQIKRRNPKKIYCISIHGIFVDNSLKKLQKYGEIISTNTIPSKISKIDVSKKIKEIK